MKAVVVGIWCTQSVCCAASALWLIANGLPWWSIPFMTMAAVGLLIAAACS